MDTLLNWKDSQRESLEKIIQEVRAERAARNEPIENSKNALPIKPAGPPPQLHRARG